MKEVKRKQIKSNSVKSPDPPGKHTFAALDRAAGGRTDLPPITLYTFYQLDKGWVSSKAGFPPCRKEVFGTVLFCRLLHL